MLTPLHRQHKLTNMENTLELAEGASSSDPEVGLRAVAGNLARRHLGPLPAGQLIPLGASRSGWRNAADLTCPRTQISSSVRCKYERPTGLDGAISAARRAFSMTYSITERDAPSIAGAA
jgi:hypothetical protein